MAVVHGEEKVQHLAGVLKVIAIAIVIDESRHLFEQGCQYRSISAYHFAISSVHEKMDGYEVGQHPMVSRVIKGIFHERPPQSDTQVMSYI